MGQNAGSVKVADNSASIPKIVVTEGKAAGKEFKLSDRAVFEIGRAASSNIEIPDTGVAMNHCRIYKEQGTFTLYDLNTNKGTFINGERITKDVLADGDTIQIGPVLMIFRNPISASEELEIGLPEVDEEAEPAPWEAAPKDEGQAEVPKEEKDTGVIADEPVLEEGADAVMVADSARLTVLEGPIAGTVFELEGKSEFSIGRASDADVKIMDIKISRHHTRIANVGGQWKAIDRDSRNGTFLNGEQIHDTPLKDGDHLKVGFSIMQFNLVGAAPAVAQPEPEPVIPLEPEPPKPKKKKKAPKTKRKARATPEAPPPTSKDLACDLCSRNLSAEDLDSGLAVAHQGKHYCLTCVRKLGNLASAGPAPGHAESAGTPRDSLDDDDIDLLLKEEVPEEDEELFP